jgi:hypothetical protein
LVVLLAGCLGPADPDGGGLTFVAAPADGIDMVVGDELGRPSDPYMSIAGPAAVADVDGDGDPDVFVGDEGPNHLYLNDGDGTFTDATNRSGIPQDPYTQAALFLDVENDGDPDLFLGNDREPARLLRNGGDGTFTDVSGEAGVARTTQAYAAAAVDVNGDGYLEISVGNYGPRRAEGPSSWANATNGAWDLLYVNQRDGTFEERGRAMGLDATRWTLSHAWNDVDRDGDPDLYVNVDFGRDVLYENRDGIRFVPVTREAGTVTNRNGMGAHWVDVDGDRDLDLFTTNIDVPRNRSIPAYRGNNLFGNTGNGTFEDVAPEAGIARGGWGWDSAWADLDHDGDPDAFQANGMTTYDGPDSYVAAEPRIVPEEPPSRSSRHALSTRYNESSWLLHVWDEGVNTPVQRSSVGGDQVDRLWVNEGDGTFTDRAAEAGITEATDSRAVPLLDADGDGDLDVLRTAFREEVDLLENRLVRDGEAPDDGHWLQVELVGTDSNRDAVGARLLAEAGDETMLRHRSAGAGFMTQDQSALHLGLGEHERVDELTVTWPGGATATFEDVAADQRIRVTEPDQLETRTWSGT